MRGDVGTRHLLERVGSTTPVESPHLIRLRRRGSHDRRHRAIRSQSGQEAALNSIQAQGFKARGGPEQVGSTWLRGRPRFDRGAGIHEREGIERDEKKYDGSGESGIIFGIARR